MILATTTLDETPQALHDYGLEQLEKIRAESLEIAHALIGPSSDCDTAAADPLDRPCR